MPFTILPIPDDVSPLMRFELPVRGCAYYSLRRAPWTGVSTFKRLPTRNFDYHLHRSEDVSLRLILS